ncbi:MAG: UDP-N-acetylmuramoyl-L-alanyl-D-glutamate--2,6-diaminopimelate ligase [Bacteroidetes bacterium]|nr:UDP-N-acetylmuramoyl-L-alanyl-D-glutamate--2,6-diaminopimelate ligase [Bacteroidota bacterium]
MTVKNGRWLADLLGVSCQDSKADAKISTLVYDSRKAGYGALFFAVGGFKTDGNSFARKAIESGSVFVLSEQEKPEDLLFSGWIRVENIRTAMAFVSRAFYDFPDQDLTLIGVTGTNGKTTTTFLIRQILETAGLKTGIIGTTGAFYGKTSIELAHTTPESVDLCDILDKMRKAGVTHVVMEVSSHALVLGRVHGFRFPVTVFTNLTHDHLDFHKTPEAYLEAKKMLFDSQIKEDFAIINSDDPASKQIIRDCRAEISSYGIESAATVRAEIISSDIYAQKIRISDFGSGLRELGLPLAGKFNVYNSLAAYAAGRKLGLDPEVIIEALSYGVQVPGRFEKVTSKLGLVTGVVDYSHTPDSLLKILESIRLIKKSGQKLITVFGCGGDRDRTKRPVMGEIAERLSDVAIVTSDNPRTENPDEILKEILVGMKGQTQLVEADRRKAIQLAVQMAEPGAIILVAGKGHETYQEIAGVRHHFDDREELREALKLYGK